MTTPYGHTAYTRTSKTGKVSQIKVKGSKPIDVPAPKPSTQIRVIGRGIVHLLQRRAPGHGEHVTLPPHAVDYVLNYTKFALVSAGPNPNRPEDKNLSPEQLQQRHKQLGERLKDAGFMFTHVIGHYSGVEDSYLVMMHDVDREVAMDLGKQFHQDSIVYGDNGKWQMHFTTGEHRDTYIPGESYEKTPEAEDNYTIVKHPDGTNTKFSLNFEWGKFLRKALWRALLSKAEKPYGHTAYTRTSKTGKVSQIRAKGVPRTHKEAAADIADRVHEASQHKPGYPGREKVEKNWRKQIDTTGIPEEAFDAVDHAITLNDANDAYASAKARFGIPDGVVLLNVSPTRGQRMESGLRDDGTGTTYLFYRGTPPTQSSGPLVPGPGSISTQRGVAATIRHEYGHSVYDHLMKIEDGRKAWSDLRDIIGHDRTVQSHGRYHLDDRSALANQISRYASTNDEELFSETFALVTDETFNPTLYDPAVQKYLHAFQEFIGQPVRKSRGPALVITLRKARPHGSQNKDHDYLLRYMDPMTGEWKRVYPDERDGHFDEHGQFHLAEGKTVAGIIHAAMFGGNTGKKSRTTGAPIFKPGRLVEYAVVHAKQYEAAATRAKLEKRQDPYARNATHVEKVGDYVVFTYPKKHAIEWDKAGKPIKWGGIAKPEVHTSLTTTHGYEIPEKLKTYEVTTAAHHKHLEAVHALVPEGPERTSELHPPIPGTQQIFPHLSHQPEREWFGGEGTLPGQVRGPLDIAKRMIERLALTKKQRESSKVPSAATHVEAFPSWVLDKFKDEQELSDELKRRPITTLITLGQIKLDASQPKLIQMLTDEWYGKIRGMAGVSGFDALKDTKDYKDKEEADIAAGKEHAPDSQVREYRIGKTNDLAQRGMLKLLEIAQGKYKPKLDDPRDRFDKYVARAVHNEIKGVSAKLALEGATTDPILHEGEIDEAARIAGGRAEPLPPDEAAELHRVTPLAKFALHKILQELPETYRRVLNARLWLAQDELFDAGKEEEQAHLRAGESGVRRGKYAVLEAEQETERLAGKDPSIRRRDAEGWRRDYTGPEGVSSLYSDWTDPDTGKPVDLDGYSEKHQRRKLQEWFDEGVKTVFRNLSHDGKLTEEGVAVRSWLTLEAKLAGANRRQWAEGSVPVAKKPPAPLEGKMTPLKVVMHPAIEFFSRTPNQALAVKLGLSGADLPVHEFIGAQQPGIQLGRQREHVLQLAVGYHDRIKALQKMSPAALDAAHTEAHHRVAMTAPGQWTALHQQANDVIAHRGKPEYAAKRKEFSAHVAKMKTYSPDAAAFYDASVTAGVPVNHEQEVRVHATISRSGLVAANDVALVDLVRGVTKAITSIRVRREDTMDTLTKAFYDYDFEMGRLHATVAA